MLDSDMLPYVRLQTPHNVLIAFWRSFNARKIGAVGRELTIAVPAGILLFLLLFPEIHFAIIGMLKNTQIFKSMVNWYLIHNAFNVHQLAELSDLLGQPVWNTGIEDLRKILDHLEWLSDEQVVQVLLAWDTVKNFCSNDWTAFSKSLLNFAEFLLLGHIEIRQR